jgi:protein SCO1/2
MLSRRHLLVQTAAISAISVLAACKKKAAPVGPKDPMEPGGPFHLINQDGHPVDDSVLNGKWTALYFGYTFCPDACPTTLQALALALPKLGSKAKGLQTLFITVDPERDTPAQMKTYIASPVFPRPIMGLTGTTEQVAAAAKAYKLYYKKAPLEGGAPGEYLMDHQSIIYLMNPDGRLARPLTSALTPDGIAKQIGDAMSQYG